MQPKKNEKRTVKIVKKQHSLNIALRITFFTFVYFEYIFAKKLLNLV